MPDKHHNLYLHFEIGKQIGIFALPCFYVSLWKKARSSAFCDCYNRVLIGFLYKVEFVWFFVVVEHYVATRRLMLSSTFCDRLIRRYVSTRIVNIGKEMKSNLGQTKNKMRIWSHFVNYKTIYRYLSSF